MKYIWKSYISVLLIISLTITALSNVAGAASNSTREVKAPNESSVEKSVYSINASISPEISAKVKELKKTVKREAKEFTTENSRHYELNDGTYIAEYSSTAQNYKNEQGDWKPINTRLTDVSPIVGNNSSISKEASLITKQKLLENDKKAQEEASYMPLEVPYGAEIPKDYSKGYTVTKDNSSVKVFPVDSRSVIGTVYSEDSIHYLNAWENTDVVLTASNEGIKEDIILKDKNSPHSFLFELQGNFKNDNVELEDLSILPAWLIDNKGQYRDVQQKITKKGNKRILELLVNTDNLEFPIRIDPTVSIYDSNSSLGRYYTWINSPSGSSGYWNPTTIDVFKKYDDFSNLVTGGGQLSFVLEQFPAAASKIQYAYLQMNYIALSGTQQVVDLQYQYDFSNFSVNSGQTTVYASNNAVNFDFTNAIKSWYSSFQPNVHSRIDLFLSTGTMGSDFHYSVWNPTLPKFIIGYNVYAPGTAAITAPQSGTTVDANYNITWNAAIDQDDPQSSLKYNIQLSTNGGATWSDIVPLTAAGASSYTYNFSSIGNTTNAIIRIRPFDGIDYGAWVQSPTFTIKHNMVPNAPTALNPGSTSSTTPQLMGTTTPALNWTFSDPDSGDTQGQYQVYIYNGTTLIRDSGWVSSSAASYTVPTGTLSRNGTYNWQVRTKDNKGAISAVSAKYYIKVNNLPTVSVTSYTNGQQVTDNVLTFTWTYSDADGQSQSHYQIQGSQDNWTTVAYNSGALSGNATSFTTPPLASGTWSFRITAKDGLEWSAAATRSLVLPNAYEPNDTTAQAYPINYAQNYTSLITTATDVDFYKYTATAAGIEKFKLTVPTGLNYDVYVYDASMNLIAAGIRGTGLAEEIIYNVNAGAAYYIKIVGVGGSYSATTSYGFSLTRQAAQYTTTYQYDFNGNITGKTVTITN
ncbi:hypothetical protein [Cohnella sp. GbtcB17]|uniref:glycoside hydrolase family 78 protein n=1 Tax=Cohnella sp. GbtcB17 TaxID=2824762 RepID=UPI001C2FE81F|nr:hypothetical protein [Cohnella sp. GbtcB17]